MPSGGEGGTSSPAVHGRTSVATAGGAGWWPAHTRGVECPGFWRWGRRGAEAAAEVGGAGGAGGGVARLTPGRTEQPLAPDTGERSWCGAAAALYRSPVPVKRSVGCPRRGEAKPRGHSQDQKALLHLGGRLSTGGSPTWRGMALRYRLQVPHRAEGFPSTVRGGRAWERRCGPPCVRWGKPTIFLRQGGPGSQRERGPGHGSVPVPRRRVTVAGVPALDPRRSLHLGGAVRSRVAGATAGGAHWARGAAVGEREPPAGEAVSRPTRHQGGRIRPGGGCPRRGGVLRWAIVGRGGWGVPANLGASTSAQQTLAPDAGEWGSVAGDRLGSPGAGEAQR
jgi:hypothetical protein